MPCTALGPAGGWKPRRSSAGALRRAVPVHACGRACTDAGGVRALSGAGVTGTRAGAVAVLASGIIGPGRRMEARGRFYRESSAHVPGSINCWAPLTCVGSRLDGCMRDAAFNLHLSAPLPPRRSGLRVFPCAAQSNSALLLAVGTHGETVSLDFHRAGFLFRVRNKQDAQELI